MSTTNNESFWRGVGGHNDGSLEGQQGWNASPEKERQVRLAREARQRQDREAREKAEQIRRQQEEEQKWQEQPPKPPSSRNGWQTFIGIGVFIASGFYTLMLLTEDTQRDATKLIISGVVGAIFGYIAYRLYKFVIFVLLAALGIYIYQQTQK